MCVGRRYDARSAVCRQRNNTWDNVSSLRQMARILFLTPMLFSGCQEGGKLWRLLPNFRSPGLIRDNSRFFLDTPLKEAVLSMLSEGLRGDWDVLPEPGVLCNNFLSDPIAREKCRQRFKNEILKGRMIGGPGWSANVVTRFLGAPFYSIPCGAVPKKDDPFGQIIHNYNNKIGWRSININYCLIDNFNYGVH